MDGQRKKLAKVAVAIIYIGIMILILGILGNKYLAGKNEKNQRIEISNVVNTAQNNVNKNNEESSSLKKIIESVDFAKNNGKMTTHRVEGDWVEFDGVINYQNFREVRATLIVTNVRYLVRQVNNILQTSVEIDGYIYNTDVGNIKVYLDFDRGKMIQPGDAIDVKLRVADYNGRKVVLGVYF
jgi:hypothetical protein